MDRILAPEVRVTDVARRLQDMDKRHSDQRTVLVAMAWFAVCTIGCILLVGAIVG